DQGRLHAVDVILREDRRQLARRGRARRRGRDEGLRQAGVRDANGERRARRDLEGADVYVWDGDDRDLRDRFERGEAARFARARLVVVQGRRLLADEVVGGEQRQPVGPARASEDGVGRDLERLDRRERAGSQL